MLAGIQPPNSESIQLAVKRLAELIRALSNCRWILIIEELRNGEKDVSSLATSIELPDSAISQQLAVLQTHKVVIDHKEGRQIFYRLHDPELARWRRYGLKFIEPNSDASGSSLLKGSGDGMESNS